VFAWVVVLAAVAAVWLGVLMRPAEAGTGIARSTQVSWAAAAVRVTGLAAADPVVRDRVAEGRKTRYVVQPGDSLSGIAAALGVTGGWPAVYAANRAVIGPDPGLVRAGTVLTIPSRPAPAAPAPPPAPAPPAPRHHPAPPGGRHHRPARPTALAGIPRWLTALLAIAALVIAAAFAADFAAAAWRRRRRAAPAAPAAAPAVTAVTAATVDCGSARAGRGGIVVADYDRLVVTWSPSDDTTYVLRPPGTEPSVILPIARLVLPEVRYIQLAARLGVPASWPIVLADYPKLVVTRSSNDDTVYVLRPPGEDPEAVLRAARLVLPEGPYGELADQLGVPAAWPVEQL
jgi:LysM domain